MQVFKTFRKARSFARNYTHDGRRPVSVLVLGAAYRLNPERPDLLEFAPERHVEKLAVARKGDR